MSKNPARLADKNTIFICQLTESSLRVVKCQPYRPIQRKFLDLEIFNFTQGDNDEIVAEKISELLNGLGFNKNPVIVSLPRSNVTARYLKIPSQSLEEIENIISLQAPRYLPYPAAELITGYEHIQTDKEGFSHINMIVVHKSIIERFIRLFSALKIKDFSLTLSSYGLSNLLSFFYPEQQDPVMLIDIQHPHVELVITKGAKLVFSRAFKISEMDWQANLAMELNKTRDAYLKELPFKEPVKIIIFDHPGISRKIEESLSANTNLPVERLAYQDKITATPVFSKKMTQAENSLAVAVGIGLKIIPETLNLLPREIKERLKKQTKVRENTKTAILVFGIIAALSLGLRQNLNNKELYLGKLKNELNKIERDASGLVELERRYQLLDKRKEKPFLTLELISQLHDLIPQEMLLNNFSYEEDKQITLRGQAPQSQIVFAFLKKLETSEAFKKFSIKIRYVTQRKIQESEVADFEIVCIKEK